MARKKGKMAVGVHHRDVRIGKRTHGVYWGTPSTYNRNNRNFLTWGNASKFADKKAADLRKQGYSVQVDRIRD